MILSIIGLGAVIVPALLLLLMTARTREVPDVPTEDRQVNAKDIQDTTNKQSFSSNKLVPSPFSSPASSSALPKESSKSSGTSK